MCFWTIILYQQNIKYKDTDQRIMLLTLGRILCPENWIQCSVFFYIYTSIFLKNLMYLKIWKLHIHQIFLGIHQIFLVKLKNCSKCWWRLSKIKGKLSKLHLKHKNFRLRRAKNAKSYSKLLIFGMYEKNLMYSKN